MCGPTCAKNRHFFEKCYPIIVYEDDTQKGCRHIFHTVVCATPETIAIAAAMVYLNLITKFVS